MSTKKSSNKIKKPQTTLAQDNPFPLDESGVAIVTFVEGKRKSNEIKLMNMSCYSRNEDLPDPDVTRIVAFDLHQIDLTSATTEKVALLKAIETSFERLYKEEIVALTLRNIPGVGLYDFIPKTVEAGSAAQWSPDDIKALLRAIRKACGVTMILH